MRKLFFITIFICLQVLLFAQADSWKTIQTGYSDMSGVIYAPAKDTVFVHRMDGVLIRSFNGGTTWDSTFIRHDSIRFTDIGSTFVNGKIGFTWGIWGCMYTGIKHERPILLKTNNSGSNWEISMNGLPLSEVKKISLVHFWDAENGILVAECGSSHHENHTYTTFNGGKDWVESSAFNPMLKYAPRMASFTDRYNGVMCGVELNLNFSMTDNGGYDWKNTTVHKLNYSPTGIKLFNDNSGFILANDSVYTSDDNFKNFNRKALPFSNYNNTILSNNASSFSIDNKTSYFLTFNDGIYKTNDGLKSFTISKPKNNLPNYSLAGFENDIYVYALNGTVYKTTEVKNIASSNKNKSQVTVFPNPTSGNKLTINSNLDIQHYALYSILGVLIEKNTINNKSIDVSRLATGSYILNVYNEFNELIDTKKIVKTIEN